MTAHWIWLAVTIAAMAWYSTITIYVAVRGCWDIRHMLDRLEQSARDE